MQVTSDRLKAFIPGQSDMLWWFKEMMKRVLNLSKPSVNETYQERM